MRVWNDKQSVNLILLVRVDVPVVLDVDKSVKVAEEFLNDLYKEVPEEYREYIFGKNKK